MENAGHFNLHRLKGQKVLITGGSGLLGRALVDAFLKEGASVIVLTKNKETDFKSSLDSRNIYCADFLDATETKDIISSILASHNIDILINNAGVNLMKSAIEMTRDEMMSTLEVNLLAPFQLMQAVVSQMIQRRAEGCIVNIASVKGMEASADPGYGASKAGLIQLTRTFAQAFGKDGIRVNAIAPAPLEFTAYSTMDGAKRSRYLQRIAAGHFGLPEDIASVAVFLASIQAKYVTGQCIRVDGGYAL